MINIFGSGRVQWVLLYKHGATKLRNWQNFLQGLNTNEIIATSENFEQKHWSQYSFNYFFNEIIIFSEKVDNLLIGEGMAVLSILPNILYRDVINVYITRFSRFAEIGFN